MKPILYITAVPNGTGKTTASFKALPRKLNCREFVTYDKISSRLFPFDINSEAIKSDKILLGRIITLYSHKFDRRDVLRHE